jgi:hypothetical protein
MESEIFQVFKRLSKTEANQIRAESYYDAYSKVDGNEKQSLKNAVNALCEISGIGEGYAIQLLAVIAQALDAGDWPKKNGD